MKLYLIDIYEAYMASEQGVAAMRNVPDDDAYYKYDILEEADVELPSGYTLEKTQGDGEEIFKGNEAAEMITELVNGKYITSLVTSAGIVKLHKWDYV